MWDLLATSDPAEVAGRAAVAFDPAGGGYRVPVFGRTLSVHPEGRRIMGLDPGGEVFLERCAGFFRLSILWYLLKASSLRPSGTLIRPSQLPGGDIFVRGSHVLPLDALAATYATRPHDFLAAGAALGGRPARYGDAAVVISPLPKVPTTVLLWTADDEFPARADLLLDATCSAHLPTDILWSLAQLSLLQFPQPASPGSVPG